MQASTVPAPDSQDAGSRVSRNFVKASDVKMRRASWLDTPMGPGWVVKTGLTILAGVQGLGKSTLSIGIAAQVSKSADVLIFSAEDDPNTTLVPRLAAANADLDRVHIFKDVESFSLGDQGGELLAAAVQETRAKLVIFDPVIAYLSMNADAHKDHDVRVVLRALQSVAQSHKFAALGIMHFKKDNASSEALYRVSGSIAFTAAPRSVLGLVKVDNDLLLVHLKCNVGEERKSRVLTREIRAVGGIKAAVLNVGGASDVTKDDLHETRRRGPEPVMKTAAKSWLIQNVVATDEGTAIALLRERSDADGHSWPTIKNAKVVLEREGRMASVRDHEGPKPTHWRQTTPLNY